MTKIVFKKKYLKVLFSGVLGLAAYGLFMFIATYPSDYFKITFNHFKNDPKFSCQRHKSYLTLYRKGEASKSLESVFKNPEQAFSDSSEWIKDQRIRCIVVYEVDGKKYLIKRHLNYKLDQYFLHNSSKALRSFYYGCLFDEMNIPNPQSIAVIEKRIGILRLASYQIMEFVPGLIGDDYLKAQESLSSELRDSIAQSVDIVRKLDEAKIIHGDLRVKHLFYVGHTAYMIDLDTVHQYRFKNVAFMNRQKAKDLKGFVMGMEANLSREDFEFFGKCYISEMNRQVDPYLDSAI